MNQTKPTINIRVRFAPSPTGALHLGGARTALFNWLFAKHHDGKFILRIEDTDKERSTAAAVKTILDGLKYLGIYWDEGPKADGAFGPYLQTARLHLYKKYAEQLVKEGKAYYCYCTTEELKKERAKQNKNKQAPKYSKKCRFLSEEEGQRLHLGSKNRVLRFKMPEAGQTKFTDLCRGDVKFENDLLDDFIIMKSDGFPTYNFAAVVDDHLMEITHVIRGDDHLSNTPRQILLYQAFGWKIPRFGHIPMILGKDKARLSKRHGAKSVTEYEKEGFLPEAMVNFLSRLGWGHKDQEIFLREELAQLFTLEKVTKSPAVFDADKLTWLNGYYIKEAVPERIYDLCLPHIEKAYHGFEGTDYAKKVVAVLQERLKLITDIVDAAEYFFKDVTNYDEKAVAKHFKGEETIKIFEELKNNLAALEKFDKPSIEEVFKALAAKLNVKLGVIIHPTRLALTGRAVSPGIYDVVEILGKEKVLDRISAAIKHLTS